MAMGVAPTGLPLSIGAPLAIPPSSTAAGGTLPSPGCSSTAVGSGASTSFGFATSPTISTHIPLAGAVLSPPSVGVGVGAGVGAGVSSPAGRRSKPLLAYLAVTSLDWGTAPPFVELMNFSDALRFAGPDSPRAPTAPLDPSFPSSSLMPRGPPFPATDSGPRSGGAPQPQPQPPCSCAEAEGRGVVDSLAPFLGPGGLFVRVHITYGGSLRFSVASAAQYDLSILGPNVTLPLRMPLALSISDIDLDCYVCCNLHENTCRIWLEPGKLSSSPVNRIRATAVFGEKRRDDGVYRNPVEGSSSASGHYVVSAGGHPQTSNSTPEGDSDGNVSLDDLSRYGSTLSEDSDDDSTLVDERQVEQFLLRELKAMLKGTIMAPHYVSVPVVIAP